MNLLFLGRGNGIEYFGVLFTISSYVSKFAIVLSIALREGEPLEAKWS